MFDAQKKLLSRSERQLRPNDAEMDVSKRDVEDPGFGRQCS